MRSNRRETDPDLILGNIAQLAAVLADETNFHEALSSIDQTAKRCIGHQLFTIMTFDAATMEVARLYSSNPEAYPAGGRKRKSDTPWRRQVLEDGKPFIGNSARHIRANFDDFLTISELGLESVINIPIRICGHTIGTMNLLDEAHHYSRKSVEIGGIIAGLAGGVLLSRKLRESNHPAGIDSIQNATAGA